MDRSADRHAEAISLACHNFSDIRRRPLVIGKLDQVRLPFVVTMPQLAVGALMFGLLFLARPIWGAVMSDRLHIVVFVAVPILAAQQISRTTVEGRPLSKAAIGLARLWMAPRHGTINGRRQRPATDIQLTIAPLAPVPSVPRSSNRHSRGPSGRRTGARGRGEPPMSRRTARRRRRHQATQPDQQERPERRARRREARR